VSHLRTGLNRTEMAAKTRVYGSNSWEGVKISAPQKIECGIREQLSAASADPTCENHNSAHKSKSHLNRARDGEFNEG
jgi:hypothetical protein